MFYRAYRIMYYSKVTIQGLISIGIFIELKIRSLILLFELNKEIYFTELKRIS